MVELAELVLAVTQDAQGLVGPLVAQVPAFPPLPFHFVLVTLGQDLLTPCP